MNLALRSVAMKVLWIVLSMFFALNLYAGKRACHRDLRKCNRSVKKDVNKGYLSGDAAIDSALDSCSFEFGTCLATVDNPKDCKQELKYVKRLKKECRSEFKFSKRDCKKLKGNYKEACKEALKIAKKQCKEEASALIVSTKEKCSSLK